MKEGAKPFNQVMPIALELWQQIKPLCVPGQCKIAGSLRRKEEMVGDIEIVCVAIEEESKDMFDQPTGIKSKPLYDHLNKAIQKGDRVKDGDRYKAFIFKGIKVDLFIVPTEDFGRALAIRTGPAEYSAKVIATSWRKIGWVGTKDGLRKQYECEETGENKWKCVVSNPQKPPAFTTEEIFYQFLRLNYIAPESRGKIKQAA